MELGKCFMGFLEFLYTSAGVISRIVYYYLFAVGCDC